MKLTAIVNPEDRMHPLSDFRAPKKLLFEHFSAGTANKNGERKLFEQSWKIWKKDYFVSDEVHTFRNALRTLQEIAENIYITEMEKIEDEYYNQPQRVISLEESLQFMQRDVELSAINNQRR